MHKPLDSVVALAHFSLSDGRATQAKSLLENVSNWRAWIGQVETHGLSGFVIKHIREHDLPIPPDTLVGLRALSIRHKLAAQARYQALQQIDEVFIRNEVPYLALKGVALMPMIYHDAVLRPMRDMDLLVPASHEDKAADCVREVGFHLPQSQPNKYMKDMHQLPNATKKVNGFTVSVELHRDGYTRETDGSLAYPPAAQMQQVVWQDLRFDTFEDVKMLNQVCRHMEGLHTGAVLKLVNVMDVVGLAERVRQRPDNWQRLKKEYPHVLTSLRCLHLYTPLSEDLQQAVGNMPNNTIAGVGEIMVSMRSSILSRNKPWKQRLKLLLRPSDWWLHLYYNVDPQKSLLWVKFIRHPLRVSSWLWRRLYSRILGG